MDLVDSNSPTAASEAGSLSLPESAAVNGSNPQSAQELIVHVSLPQSVIQPTSVIQSTPSLQASGLPKGNIILVSKPNSVIHAAGAGTLQTLQVIDARDTGGLLEDENTKKRREILARRPSYRKILNELGGGEISASIEDRGDSPIDSDGSNSPAPPTHQRTVTLGGTHYQTTAGLLKVIPAGAIQLATGASGQTLGDGQGLPTLTMTNAAGGGTIVQYAQGQEGQFFVPVCVSGELQTYTLRSVTSTAGLGTGVVVGTGGPQNISGSHSLPDDSSKKRDIRLMKSSNSAGSGGHSDEWDTAEPALQKREMRLLKNREAARECRRKKKEYIKCLENRVAVLENQNKALIEELKSLKELYCNQKVD